MRDVFAGGDTYTLTEDATEADALAHWRGDGMTAFVAVDGEVVVGSYTLRRNQRGRGAHVANAGFMVHRDYAGRGIGTALGQHALDTARAAGYAAMQFNFVVSTNTRAVELWKRLGFSIVGTVPGAFMHRERGAVAVHIMHRTL